MNQDPVLALALPITLFLIMLSMGTGLTPGHFRQVLSEPLSTLAGLISQMLLLPVVAFMLLQPMQLAPEIFAGFMILALSPGGTTSNMFSYLANGNLALSVTLTAIVSILTPFTLPLMAGWMLSQQIDASHGIHLPFADTLLKLLLITLLPIALGMLIRRWKPRLCLNHEFWIMRVPLVLLMLVIAGIIYSNRLTMVDFFDQTGLPALLLSSAAILAGYLFGRTIMQRNRADSRTIAIETSIQNGGTAILITGTILNNPAMTIAPVMYGILMLIPVFSYILLSRRKPALSLP